MSRKRYSNYYNSTYENAVKAINEYPKEETKTPEEDKVEEETLEDLPLNEESEIEEVVEETVVEEVTEPEPVVEEPATTGKITGCEKVNVRMKPDANAKVVTILDKDTIVTVNIAASTTDFYAVITPTDQPGFIMKQFVTL